MILNPVMIGGKAPLPPKDTLQNMSWTDIGTDGGNGTERITYANGGGIGGVPNGGSGANGFGDATVLMHASAISGGGGGGFYQGSGGASNGGNGGTGAIMIRIAV